MGDINMSDEVNESLAVTERIALIEALIIAYGEPLAVERIVEVTAYSESDVLHALEMIRLRYLEDEKGFELVKIAGAYQFRTKPKFAAFVRELKAGAPRKLSAPALETLAIVAYRQPIVKSDVEKIRGVDATPTLKTLLERDLIKIVGHQSTVGQPALYGTTDEFLKLFGLGSLSELPTLRDLKELDEDPGEEPSEDRSGEGGELQDDLARESV